MPDSRTCSECQTPMVPWTEDEPVFHEGVILDTAPLAGFECPCCRKFEPTEEGRAAYRVAADAVRAEAFSGPPPHYVVRYEQDENGVWVATVPAVDGCFTQGPTFAEARARIREALSLFIDDADTATLIEEMADPEGPSVESLAEIPELPPGTKWVRNPYLDRIAKEGIQLPVEAVIQEDGEPWKKD